MNVYIETLGFAASVVSFVLWWPQAMRVWQCRHSGAHLSGVSISSQALLLVNAALWGAYAIVTGRSGSVHRDWSTDRSPSSRSSSCTGPAARTLDRTRAVRAAGSTHKSLKSFAAARISATESPSITRWTYTMPSAPGLCSDTVPGTSQGSIFAVLTDRAGPVAGRARPFLPVSYPGDKFGDSFAPNWPGESALFRIVGVTETEAQGAPTSTLRQSERRRTPTASRHARHSSSPTAPGSLPRRSAARSSRTSPACRFSGTRFPSSTRSTARERCPRHPAIEQIGASRSSSRR